MDLGQQSYQAEELIITVPCFYIWVRSSFNPEHVLKFQFEWITSVEIWID